MSYDPSKKARIRRRSNDDDDNNNNNNNNNNNSNYFEQVQRTILDRLTREALIAGVNGNGDRLYASHFASTNENKDENGKPARKPQDKRITELLAEHLTTQMTLGQTALCQGDQLQKQKMEGDVASLGMHPSFFVEGVRIGWPYPLVMTPQRQVGTSRMDLLDTPNNPNTGFHSLTYTN